MFRPSTHLQLLISAMLIAAGCTSSTRPGDLRHINPRSDAPRAGNVYLLRGWIGVFSSGMDRLTAQINEIGVRANVYQDDQWAALAREIRAKYGSAPQHEPLVLIGHSYGADDAIRVARELDQDGIAVDMLITLDPVTPPPVPRNVRHCVNIYQSNGPLDRLPFLRGVAVRQEPDAKGRLDNFDIRADRQDLLDPGTNHFNVEKRPKIHEEVIGHVLAACPPRSTWLASRAAPPPAEPSETAQPASHRLGN